MTIVLLHGFCEDHRIWDPLLASSKHRKDMVCIDLPGFGKNASMHALGESVGAMAEFVKAEIEKLGISKVIFIGHSLGGYVTLALAEKYPNRVAGIGLFHSTAMPDNEERKEGRMKTIAFVNTHGAEAYHRVLIPNLFKPGTSETVIESTIAMAKSSKSEGIITALMAMRNRPDRMDVLRNFDKPVLFIAGESDLLIPKSSIMEQATQCSVAQLEVLEHSAHMGLIEEPERSAAIIDAFCDFVVEFKSEEPGER